MRKGEPILEYGGTREIRSDLGGPPPSLNINGDDSATYREGKGEKPPREGEWKET